MKSTSSNGTRERRAQAWSELADVTSRLDGGRLDTAAIDRRRNDLVDEIGEITAKFDPEGRSHPWERSA